VTIAPAAALAVAVALAWAAPAAGGPSARSGRHAARAPGGRGEVVLEGERVPVRWTDGDTFKIGGGRFAGRAARLAGVNALETFGPVHRFAGMDAAALLRIAKATAPAAAARAWRCETDGRADAYRRLLVRCPDAAEALVREGYAMVFAIDAPPEPRLLEAQRAAQAARAGIWAGGVPPRIPTSLHSADEPDLGPRGAYDRVADTRTGVADAVPHDRVYAPCEERCAGEGADRACMTYVPFERRYRHRPACLRPAAGP
jgi:endonuclease YncB( thermonuclease family)